jgi:hypothetical protein
MSCMFGTSGMVVYKLHFCVPNGQDVKPHELFCDLIMIIFGTYSHTERCYMMQRCSHNV